MSGTIPRKMTFQLNGSPKRLQKLDSTPKLAHFYDLPAMMNPVLENNTTMTIQDFASVDPPFPGSPLSRMRSDTTMMTDDDRLYIHNRVKTTTTQYTDDFLAGLGHDSGSIRSSGVPSGEIYGSEDDEREPENAEMDTMRRESIEIDDRMDQRVSMLKKEVERMELEIKMKDKEIGMLKVDQLSRDRAYEEQLVSQRHLVKKYVKEIRRLRELQERKRNRGWFSGCY